MAGSSEGNRHVDRNGANNRNRRRRRREEREQNDNVSNFILAGYVFKQSK